uniref:Radical SAM protein n=1 Tax=Staphylothermus marinus TaxID=2280 RepID=A0A7C4NP77_STAMA
MNRRYIDIFFLRPDAFSVWDYEEVRKSLSWYRRVMTNEKPAKYRVVKRIEVRRNPYEIDDIEELWNLHRDAEEEFRSLMRNIVNDQVETNDITRIEPPPYSFLDVKIALAYKLMVECKLCERKCGVKRFEGMKGVCLMSNKCIVHSYFHHMGEEAPLVPSGTIFYGGCNFKCVYCQNYDISQVYPENGEIVDPVELANIQKELRLTGARNINHVGGDPTPHLYFILCSFKYLDINTPQLWNSNMYLTMESMKLLVDVIDIWLPDLKYGNDECAYRLSNIRNYWSIVTRNIKYAYENGDMIIRHLVLPNHIDCCTKPVLKWIAENTPKALVNVMEQYRPEHLVVKYPDKFRDINRRLRREEILEAYSYAESLGLIYKPVS